MRTKLLAGLAIFAGLVLAPGAAAEKPGGWDIQKRSLELELEAQATNGYELTLQTLGHRQVAMTLRKGGVYVSYRTEGQVSRNRIEADFGGVGKVSLRFRGRPAPFPFLPNLGLDLPRNIFPHRDCRGRKPVREVGVFRGSIRFEGERGFAALTTHRAKGEMRRVYERHCKRGSLPRPNGRPGFDGKLLLNALTVGGRVGDRSVFFETIGVQGGGEFGEALDSLIGNLTAAGTVERRDGVRIDRLVIAEGGEGSLLLSQPGTQPVSATVTLPKPFEGSAELTRAANAPAEWIGSLSLRLPGAGLVPLTGAGLTAILCRISELDEVEPACLKRAAKAVPERPVIGELFF